MVYALIPSSRPYRTTLKIQEAPQSPLAGFPPRVFRFAHPFPHPAPALHLHPLQRWQRDRCHHRSPPLRVCAVCSHPPAPAANPLSQHSFLQSFPPRPPRPCTPYADTGSRTPQNNSTQPFAVRQRSRVAEPGTECAGTTNDSNGSPESQTASTNDNDTSTALLSRSTGHDTTRRPAC